MQASVDGEVLGTGKEFNKKNAEKLAAEKACEALGI
jgi:ribonuclease-3